MENTERKSKEALKSKVDTRYINPVLWPSPYACAQSYHPGMYQTTMVNCFGLVKLHQYDIAITCRSGFFQHPLNGSSTFKILFKLYQFSFKTYPNLFLSLIISVFQYVRPQFLKHLFQVISSPQSVGMNAITRGQV